MVQGHLKNDKMSHEITESWQNTGESSARCFQQIWKLGKVGKVGRVSKVGKVGKEGKEGKEGRLRE
jgi:hypothetical protein